MSIKIKEQVKSAYGAIARAADTEGSSPCCAPTQNNQALFSCCGSSDKSKYSGLTLLYSELPGYEAGADLGLGCGIPYRHDLIKPGDTVLDLGSGSGNDAFIAAAATGPQGRVLGIDISPDMVSRAKKLAEKKKVSTVEFMLGDIESLPIADGSIDVLISNCVLNLVPNKAKAFAEIHRVLKTPGRFRISDIVSKGVLPPLVQQNLELYTACVAGAVDIEEYLGLMGKAGFSSIQVESSHVLSTNPTVLSNFNQDLVQEMQASGAEVLSVTISGTK